MSITVGSAACPLPAVSAIDLADTAVVITTPTDTMPASGHRAHSIRTPRRHMDLRGRTPRDSRSKPIAALALSLTDVKVTLMLGCHMEIHRAPPWLKLLCTLRRSTVFAALSYTIVATPL
ncbi:hypothetical protein [Nocardia aurantiaca]|uniref:Uncharacterized protein n=1 Tax=Nocardia aurantiaca TaxID=2675850 RepID=A0A6I3L1T5_9NOCA|nr:hypothetical protein [Nocardia aurantiaca]MTE16963.1 hypothetical protein [Nocardia aurantiaca]